MKLTIKLILSALALSTLSACAVYTPAGSVVLGDGGYGYGGGYEHEHEHHHHEHGDHDD